MKPQIKHFLTGEELSQSELMQLLNTAELMKINRDHLADKPLAGKSIALLFEKPSLRTRLSFTVGIQELGGEAVELVASQQKNEEPEDVIRVLQGMVHGLMLRTFSHDVFGKMAKYATIPIINGLSDSHHPCQALADLLTLKQRFGRLQGLKLAYLGDGNNVLHSLLLLAPFLGVSVNYACPAKYQPDAGILARALRRAKMAGAKIEAFGSPSAAVHDCHAVYTDVWASMGSESEAHEREQILKPYQLNLKLFKQARPDAVAMHCLPMVREKEITSQVADHARSVLFEQAENRLHAQKALLKHLLVASVARRIEAYANVI